MSSVNSKNIPVIRTKKVFHIGSLKVEDKASVFTSSLEGHCLSVSLCPVAWRSIAKIGGYPLWKMEAPDAVFLDIHKVAENKNLRQAIESWGSAKGYSETKTLWKSWSVDEEGEWRYMICATESEARGEAEGLDEGPDGRPVVEPTAVLVGTAALCQRIFTSRLDDSDAFDFVAMVWAEDTIPDLDGVWWQETYAPECLSAPRGGIFPSRLARWGSSEVSFDAVCDDESGRQIKKGYLKDGLRKTSPSMCL